MTMMYRIVVTVDERIVKDDEHIEKQQGHGSTVDSNGND